MNVSEIKAKTNQVLFHLLEKIEKGEATAEDLQALPTVAKLCKELIPSPSL